MKKSTKIALGLTAGVAVATPIFLLAPGRASKVKKAPFKGRNFAHRGLHTMDKTVPENSLAAFGQAVEAGYGVELDVRLTRDNAVVVFHDETLERVCGVEGRIEDLTYHQVCELRLNGTEEGVPLLSEVLSLVNGRSPVIVELKHGDRNRELCRHTAALLDNYQGPVCVESFEPAMLAWFRFHAPRYLRGQLAAPRSEYRERSKMAGFLLSNLLLNFLGRPQFIAYRIGPKPALAKFSEFLGRVTGAMRFAWTSHSQENEKGKDGVIFEFYRPLPYFL